MTMKGSTFDDYPVITDQDWSQARATDDFSYIALKVFKLLGVSVTKLANLYETGGQHKAKVKELNYKVLQGHLIKVSRMYMSIMHLTSEKKFFESIIVLQRVLFETIINARYLIKNNNPCLFDMYVEKSLAPEREMWDVVQENISQKEGEVENIERSMLNGFTKNCSLADKNIEDINPKFSAWGPSLYEKCEKFGIEKMYTPLYAMGSHCIHTSFVDLVNYYLEEVDGVLEVKSSDNVPQESHMTSIGMITVSLCQEFSVYAFSEKVAVGLCEYFKWYGETMQKINIEAIKSRHGG